MRSAWGVDTLTLATTDIDARRTGAGAGMQGRGARRLPDTDAAKEWAPVSAGEASMALFCDSAARLLSSSRALRRLGDDLILSALQCLKAREITRGPFCFVLLLTTQGKKGHARATRIWMIFISKPCFKFSMCSFSHYFWVPNGRKFEPYKPFKDIA
jgi:hypothetical protein